MTNLKDELRNVEKTLDILNGDYGTKTQFCIYCKSVKYNGDVGIVHNPLCLIIQIRERIKEE